MRVAGYCCQHEEKKCQTMQTLTLVLTLLCLDKDTFGHAAFYINTFYQWQYTVLDSSMSYIHQDHVCLHVAQAITLNSLLESLYIKINVQQY